MDQHKQSAHTTSLYNYYIMFCPKYRFRILRGAIGKKVLNWTRKISEWKDTEIIEAHVSADHVDFVLSIRQKTQSWK